MLIDSHAHLDSERFNKDRDRLIKDLRREGIEYVITSGSSMNSSMEALKIARKYDNIYATVGIHPCCTDEMDENSIDELRKLSKDKNVIAIGEIGLDYHHMNVPIEVQKKWFKKQIELAKEVGLPIVVHDRKANQDTFDIIKEHMDERLRGVLHCYSGDVELARKYVEMGFYISISGPVTYKSATKLKQVAKEIPLKYLFVETDSPSLTPGPAGRRRNEPLFVRYVAVEIAYLKGVDVDMVEKITTNNVKKLYGI
ncbi:TatD family hydrolase [Oceanirhabdus sp. W0125-5]|uniref:TatD family hydrolase n=1 Tax=Oceanirhabdus sp. W0125-5 TaxID=2999116 RepID=UPI0022F32952|nr:TatD family hydrolase [Oceanirhabdus sp. W0125-5]WBW97807.1 TatD family hydrolase [Oceanirhabdus sp. W0125-5]